MADEDLEGKLPYPGANERDCDDGEDQWTTHLGSFLAETMGSQSERAC